MDIKEKRKMPAKLMKFWEEKYHLQEELESKSLPQIEDGEETLEDQHAR